jgi:hypothetical protein
MSKEEFYKYGESLGIKINDLQRLKMLAIADKKYTEEDLRKAISEAQRSWVVFPNHNSFEDAEVEFMYNADEIIDLLNDKKRNENS